MIRVFGGRRALTSIGFAQEFPLFTIFPFLVFLGVGGLGAGAILFYFYLSGSSVVGGLRREVWRGGLVGVEYPEVTPSHYFTPSLF